MKTLVLNDENSGWDDGSSQMHILCIDVGDHVQQIAVAATDYMEAINLRKDIVRGLKLLEETVTQPAYKEIELCSVN